MRTVLCSVCLAVSLSGFSRLTETRDKPVAPSEAKNFVGKSITVEMEVKASKKSIKMKKVFLDSMENFQDPDNLGVTLTDDVEMELARQHSTSDVAGFFRKKTIRVTGKVVRRDDRTYLDVEKADQIELAKNTP